MKQLKLLSILFAICLSSFSAFAEEGSKEDNFRCERFIKGNLKDLKSKLLDNCDLNKPFSTSLAINIGEEHYLYCCHTKK